MKNIIVLGITFALLAASSSSAASAMEAEEEKEMMRLYQPRDPCPQVESIVQKAVADEFKKNPQITAGFLRVFFHDCFTGGCDASIFLAEEWDAPPNGGSVQPRVRQLVNEIRAKVNQQCNNDQAVSCADILALATRDSVVAAKGPKVDIPRGRFDSLRAGTNDALPGPSDKVRSLRQLFGRFKLDKAADLVALSGGHTVGRTRFCGGVVNPDLRRNCDSKGSQDLDVFTPIVFDNQYFVALNRSLGVFASDQGLLSQDPETRNLVLTYAASQDEFFKQWKISFDKLSRTNWLTRTNGEIRRDCTKPNGRINNIMEA